MDGTRARRQGRPQKRNAPDAREALVAAARELLRTRLPAEINRLDLARLAGVDPALVRYYFGNKDGLLLETAHRMVQEMRAERSSAQQGQESFRGKLAAYAHHLIDVLHRYPFLHDLLLEQIARAGAGEARELRREFIDEPWREVRGLLDQGVQSGEIRAVEVSFFYVALIGMCSFPMRHQFLLAQIRNTPDVSARMAAEYAAFVADTLIEGLALRAHDRRAVAEAGCAQVA
ncbi:MAG: TetR family transcriptional regulator [Acidisphaera sp.]|nr:TetR family transcriptional regulator [Acidisphaera sp.]MBV9811803.1 TetR family transcriptional regulator [Acetobacteraceae bacterium]